MLEPSGISFITIIHHYLFRTTLNSFAVIVYICCLFLAILPVIIFIFFPILVTMVFWASRESLGIGLVISFVYLYVSLLLVRHGRDD